MLKKVFVVLAVLGSAVSMSVPALADDAAYTQALENFRDQPATAPFFADSVAYALFPTIGKGGFVVGGAFGKGRAYRGGQYVGDAANFCHFFPLKL